MDSDRAQNRRKFARSKLRIPCRLQLPDGSHTGFALDLSAAGLFVQTETRAEAETPVQVTLQEPHRPPIELVARVARARGSHRAASAVRTRGLGLRIESAPEAYFQLVLELGR